MGAIDQVGSKQQVSAHRGFLKRRAEARKKGYPHRATRTTREILEAHGQKYKYPKQSMVISGRFGLGRPK